MKNKYNFRSNTTLLIFLTIFFATSNVLALPDLKEVSAATMSKTIGSPSYKIVDGEVDCRTPHIKRLELSKNKVITTFHNKTSSFYKPDFRLLIYNKYGMQIATANISWMMDKIAPDEKFTS